MKYLFIFSILLFSSGAIAQNRGSVKIVLNNNSKPQQLYNKSYALVIGMSKYKKNWNNLPGVQKEVKEVKKALEKHGFDVTLKRNLTKAQLYKAFSDFIQKYGFNKNNRLLIYFAGHGYTVNTAYGDKIGYIVPVDAPNPSIDERGFQSKAMEMQQIEIYAKRIQSKHVLFVFDACFAGSLFALRDAVPLAINYKTLKPVRQFITSGSADESVPDKSIFREEFVTALTTDEADANHDGYLTGTELGAFLQDNVINYSYDNQHPQYGKIRNKNLNKGDFVFVLPVSLQHPTILNPSIDEGTQIFTTGTLKLITDYSGIVKITSASSGRALQNKTVSAGSTYSFYNLPAGIVVISIFENNNLVWTSKVNIPTNSTTIKAEKTTGTLNLTTEISGSLYIDGISKREVYTGNTYTIRDLSPGNHTIKIGTTWQESIYITAGHISCSSDGSYNGHELIDMDDSDCAIGYNGKHFNLKEVIMLTILPVR